MACGISCSYWESTTQLENNLNNDRYSQYLFTGESVMSDCIELPVNSIELDVSNRNAAS